MAIDSGIATTLLTFGPYKDPSGNIDVAWSATVSLDRELFWPTGSGNYSVYEQIDQIVRSAPDGTGSIRLPQTDQAGFIDVGGSPITGGFSYSITWKTAYSKRPLVGVRLTSAMGATYDADALHQGSTTPPPAGAATYVNSITVNGQTYTGNAVLPNAVVGAGTSTVDGITDATAIGKSLLRSADQNAAQTTIGVQDLRGLIAALTARIATLEATVANQSGLISQQNAAITGKVDTASVGVTVAPLDSARKLPLVNLTPAVPLLIGNGSATIPTRPSTINPVIFDVTGATIPATGSTSGGSQAGVNGLDRQWT